jgi:D-ribose pyranose/furanose isomerase RbsD
MHLGGFKLEARVDLKVQLLEKITKDRLRNIETRFGHSDDVFVADETIPKPEKAAQRLRTMLEVVNGLERAAELHTY